MKAHGTYQSICIILGPISPSYFQNIVTGEGTVGEGTIGEGTLLPHYINVIKHWKTHPNKLGCICAHKERYSRSSVGNPIQVDSRNTFILNFVSTIPLRLIYIPPSSSVPGSYSYSQAYNPQTRGKIFLLGSNSQKEERFPAVRTMPLDPGTF